MLHARFAYKDAVRASELLKRSTDEDQIRVYWAAALLLARTAMDVLDKVDRRGSSAASKAINAQWERIKNNAAGEHDIFCKFLKPERDMLIHQYAQNAKLELDFLVLEDGVSKLLTENGNAIIANDFFLLKQGEFKDRDARELLSEALEWVNARISEIEFEVSDSP